MSRMLDTLTPSFVHLWTGFVCSPMSFALSAVLVEWVWVSEKGKKKIKYWLYKRFGASGGILVRNTHTVLGCSEPNPRC